MNIDMTIDYDKILEEAKMRYEKVLNLSEELKNLFFGPSKKYWSIKTKCLAARDEFLDWEKNNVDKVGVRLIKNFHNDAPIGISAVLSGRDNF